MSLSLYSNNSDRILKLSLNRRRVDVTSHQHNSRGNYSINTWIEHFIQSDANCGSRKLPMIELCIVCIMAIIDSYCITICCK